MILLSTVVLFATGVALLVRSETRGTLVGLLKASFFVWLGAAGLHVVVHIWKLPRLLRARIPGLALRLTLVAGALVAGGVLATATLPEADRLQDRATAHIGLDGR